MFTHFFTFELRFWLRGLMVYIFLLVVAALVFSALSSDTVQVGGAVDNTFKNSPYMIQNFYAVISLLTLIMVTAFVNSAASRDFNYDTDQIIFATPIRKFDYLMGRFWGATLVAMIPMLGVLLGEVLAALMPWNDPERWGPFVAGAHLHSLIVFVIPNTIFIAAIIFAIATLTRSTVASFMGVLLLIVGYALASNIVKDLENERLALLLDPFGMTTFNILTKYYTVADKNTLIIKLTGLMLVNRLIWMAVGLAILAFTYTRFSFTKRQRRAKKQVAESETAQSARPLPEVRFAHNMGAQLLQSINQTRIDMRGILKSTVFIVLLAATLLNLMPMLFTRGGVLFGVSSLPVTYKMVEIIRGTTQLFLIAVITFFSGSLVWKEREARMDEIYDALPHPAWVTWLPKLMAMFALMAAIFLLQIIAGVVAQAWDGYTNFQLGLYFKELGLDWLKMSFLIVLAMLVHAVSPNKYVGYFAFIILMIINSFVWSPLGVESNLLIFGALPDYRYSDMYGHAPFVKGLLWFGLYWILFCSLIAGGISLLWPRGRESGWRKRLSEAGLRFKGKIRWAAAGLIIAWLAVGGWVYYNTKSLNRITTADQRRALAAEYEKAYKQNKHLVQPRITEVKYDIAIHPEARNLIFKGDQIIVNKSNQPIEKLHLSLTDSGQTDLQIERAQLEMEDSRLRYLIYNILPPLQPGESLRMHYTVSSLTRGFENEVSQIEVAQNGTFINSGLAPQIGYQSSRELAGRNERRKYDLPEKDRMPALELDCGPNCMNTYGVNNADWVDVETVISTSPDQLAIAPGSLVEEWQQEGRRYFRYRLDHPSLNFYSFMSARYEVAREQMGNVNLEVYYHKGHEYNVPKMLQAIRKSLEYFTTNFGPYRHQQARIIEFPRHSDFAQAFPGTMPYSEGIGFIADLADPEDIDMVTYVVAHEIGHQWWAHQVIGADMQGATLTSETMAQYSALMVMENMYGRDLMRKFLRYEMDKYLSSRGRELLKEQPLLKVEASQGYVHYNKGSVVLYHLKEMIGEAAVNKALRQIVDRFAYKQPPYPTSYHLVQAFREQTPADLQYLIEDLFEGITLFANRATDVAYEKRSDGKYDVSLAVESTKFKADDQGAESEVAVNDWIEIGAFAAPPPGRKYGKTLYRERVRMTSGAQTFTFTVEEAPDQAGIDPFLLLIDRVPEDNLKRAREVR